jgi:hypothetical protein
MLLEQLDRLIDKEAEAAMEQGRMRGPGSSGTPAQRVGTAFGNWAGWSSPVGLLDLLAGRAGRAFTSPGVNLYRISFPRQRGLSIGMTDTKPIRERVRQHANVPSRGDPKVRRRINAVPLRDRNRIHVQAGLLRRRMTVRETHMYEIWLQRREHVSDWNLIRSTRTFE